MQVNGYSMGLNSLQAYAAPQVSQGTSSTAAVQGAITTINESELLGFDRELRFSKDPQSKLGVVEVLDRSTGAVILQLPSQFVLNLAEIVRDRN
jgi:uncharacterized FlaG/YvyC family protein